MNIPSVELDERLDSRGFSADFTAETLKHVLEVLHSILYDEWQLLLQLLDVLLELFDYPVQYYLMAAASYRTRRRMRRVRMIRLFQWKSNVVVLVVVVIQQCGDFDTAGTVPLEV